MELITYIAFTVAIGGWMYYDAKKRKVAQPATWLVVGLFFSFFGLVAYWYWHIYSPSPTSNK